MTSSARHCIALITAAVVAVTGLAGCSGTAVSSRPAGAAAAATTSPTRLPTPAPTAAALRWFDACRLVPAATYARFVAMPGQVTAESSGPSTVASTCTYSLWGYRSGAMEVLVGKAAHDRMVQYGAEGDAPVAGIGDEALVIPFADGVSQVAARRGDTTVGISCPSTLRECERLAAYVLEPGRIPVPAAIPVTVPAADCGRVWAQVVSAMRLIDKETHQKPSDAAAAMLTSRADEFLQLPPVTPGTPIFRSLAQALDKIADPIYLQWSYGPSYTRDVLADFSADALTPFVEGCRIDVNSA